MKTKRAWKVTGLGERSVWVHGKASVKYRMGRKVRAPKWLHALGYGLFVFHSYPRASEWACNMIGVSQFLIHRCEVGPRMKLPKALESKALSKGEIVVLGNIWPTGTMMVEWVRLVPENTKEV